MFLIMEKHGEKKPVHSKADYLYLSARGWAAEDRTTPESKSDEDVIDPPIKRKPGRPKKDK